MKAMCGGELGGFCKGIGGVRPCPDHERVIYEFPDGSLGLHPKQEPKREEPSD